MLLEINTELLDMAVITPLNLFLVVLVTSPSLYSVHRGSSDVTYCILPDVVSSSGPGVAGYLTAGTGTTVMPSVPPPVDNDIGDQG